MNRDEIQRNPCTQAPDKVGPFLPMLKSRGFLGRVGENSHSYHSGTKRPDQHLKVHGAIYRLR